MIRSHDRQELVTANRAARFRRAQTLGPTAPWIVAAIATAGLYFARSVLLPIILAVLLSFLLAPIVAGLRRLRLPRAPAVFFAVSLALAGIGMASAVIVTQAATLTKDAPAYAERITAKAADVRARIRERFGSVLQTGGGSGHRKSRNARLAGMQAMNRASDGRVVPVEIRQPQPTAIDEIRDYVVPALEPVETILIVLIVSIFFLYHKEDLRDRLVRLMGTADIHRTTVALDEGVQRLSRYFLSQSIVNLAFGLAVWAALFVIGVPSPGLWGAVAGLARFVPYVGVVVGMAGPLALAAAVDPGWLMVIYVTVLFGVLEPIVGYMIEPLLYGHSTGLSPVSVVVAALFWTWIWGPIGLILSMPVTLMLVVLGRHIPAFEIFDIVLGDRPALSPAEIFYQRILAGNVESAVEQAEDQLETHSLVGYYDEVVLGGLRLAAAAHDRGAVDRATLKDICDTTLQVLAVLEDQPSMSEEPASSNRAENASWTVPGLTGRSIVCISGRGPLDQAVERLMEQLLRRSGCHVHVQPTRASMISNAAPALAAGRADAICILGLFDERSYRRMKPTIENMIAGTSGTPLLVGVARTKEHLARPPEDGPVPTLEALCNAISAGPIYMQHPK